MYDFIHEVIKKFAYVGIGFLMAIFPAEAVMPFVGFTAAHGSLNLPVAILVGVIGSTVGSTILYLIARQFDQTSTNAFIVKYGKFLGITHKRVNRAARMFDDHARGAVFFGRFIPGVRSAVSLPAGYQRMKLTTFICFTMLGSGVSALGLALLGYLVTVNIERLQHMALILSYTAGALVLLFCAIFLWRKRSKIH